MHTRTMRVMGEVPSSHDAVRGYLDSAVAEAAERWVGRAMDATAYADLVAAVLARREALSPLLHRPERFTAEPVPVRPLSAVGPARHHERRSRPRWPAGSPEGGSRADWAEPSAPRAASIAVGAGPVTPQPPTPEVRRGIGLPTRPPGRHRTPPPPPSPPEAIDLSENLGTVLDWLGRPEG